MDAINRPNCWLSQAKSKLLNGKMKILKRFCSCSIAIYHENLLQKTKDVKNIITFLILVHKCHEGLGNK
jgi:hypothetical protein